MYNYIINPNTNRQISVTTRLGKHILNNYQTHYQTHYQNKMLYNNLIGGAGFTGYTILITLGSIGYYYSSVSAYIKQNNDTLDQLNEIDYISKHHNALEKQITKSLKKADKIVKEVEQALTELEALPLTISLEEETSLQHELNMLLSDNTNLNGGAGPSIIPVIIQAGIIGFSINISYNIYTTYLEPIIDGVTRQINQSIVNINTDNVDNTDADWEWEIVETPTESRRLPPNTLNPSQAILQVGRAKKNVAQRLAILKERLTNPKYTRFKNKINVEIRNTRQQLLNLIMLERQLKKTINDPLAIVASVVN